MPSWYINRVGGTYEDHDDYYDLVSLTVGSGHVLDALRCPILCGRLGLDREHDGEARITEIVLNPAHIPADDAITILMAVHDQVEHCGDGEVMANVVGLSFWLTTLFPPRRAQELHDQLVAFAPDSETRP